MKFATLKRWVSDVFTEPDGQTICPVRMAAIGGFIMALTQSAYSVFFMKVAFDIVAFGSAYGMMLAAMGLALGMKTDAPKGVINAATS